MSLTEQQAHNGVQTALSKLKHDQRDDRGNIYRSEQWRNNPAEWTQIRLHELAEQFSDEIVTDIGKPWLRGYRKKSCSSRS